MRSIAIGCVAALLLVGAVGCKKKPAEKKSKGAEMAAGDVMAGDMKPGDMKPEERPVAKPEERPVADAPEEKPPEDKEAVPEGVLSGVKGAVEVRRGGTTEFKAAVNDTKVFAKDSVRVGKDGEATLALWDNSSVELTPESAITLNTSAAIKSPTPSVTVMAGAARFDVAQRTEGQGAFSIYTPSAAVAVQGTVLAVGVGLSGNARVAVEEGKISLVPVVKLDAKPLMLPAGRVVIVPANKVALAPKAYSAEKGGWDEWLEAEGQAAVKNAGDLANTHASAVEQLNTDSQTLESAEDKEAQAMVALAKQVAEAEKAKNAVAYKKLQPQYASHLDTQAALRAQLRLMRARRHAHAYLLSLMAGRLEGGVYKASPKERAAVRKHYQRVAVRQQKWEIRRIKRMIRHRKRIRRLHRGYYIHHANGRVLAPKMKVKLSPFYRKHRPRRRMRRASIVIPGWKRPLYRRPVYRGKRRKLQAAMWRRNKTWHQNKQWQERRRKRAMRNKAKRAIWRKQAMKRRARWAKRPAYRKAWRTKRRQWRRVRRGMGPHGMRMGMGPHGMRMGMGPHGMRLRVGPMGMRLGKGPHGMRLRVGPMGMRLGKGPHGMRMDPHGMRRGMRFDMRMRRNIRRKKLLRKRRAMGM